MTNSTLGKVVEIRLNGCQNCRHLPKLGELPHLKSLWLRNAGVEYIIEDDEEEEEVGSGKQVKIQFLALEELSLCDLPNLKGLSKEQEIIEAFPNLKHLSIEQCTSLILPPLPLLKKLERLNCSSSTLALFSQVNTLTTLKVMVEEKLTCFPIDLLVKFGNLRWLTIDGAKEISVSREGVQAFEKLKRLNIEGCETMTCIPKGFLRHLTALQSLHILSCPRLVELPEEIKHLHNLEFVRLVDLPKMSSLPQPLQHVSSLRILVLNALPQLESLPHWLNKLRTLNVTNCPKLVSLPALMSNLKDLQVNQCPELERQCERGSGDYWHNIAHIPRLRIGN